MTDAPATHDRVPDEPSGHGPGAAHERSGRRYVYAWLSLLVLTALSFAADRLHLGSLTTGIALGVAVLKAGVVFIVFMHLDREPFSIRLVAALNIGWVLLLCLGIAGDIALH